MADRTLLHAQKLPRCFSRLKYRVKGRGERLWPTRMPDVSWDAGFETGIVWGKKNIKNVYRISLYLKNKTKPSRVSCEGTFVVKMNGSINLFAYQGCRFGPESKPNPGKYHICRSVGTICGCVSWKCLYRGTSLQPRVTVPAHPWSLSATEPQKYSPFGQYWPKKSDSFKDPKQPTPSKHQPTPTNS